MVHLWPWSERQVYKILVIDDDPTGTQLLLTLLQLEGYEGAKLENWADPLVDVAAQRPDLVIMDVHLAREDGFDLSGPDAGSSRPRAGGPAGGDDFGGGSRG